MNPMGSPREFVYTARKFQAAFRKLKSFTDIAIHSKAVSNT
jgi:hypothetical protein